MADMNRYDYSVMAVITDLHCEHTGSGPMLYEEYRDKLAWLRWRVNEGWERNVLGKMAFIEEMIRRLAWSVIEVADRTEERWRQEPPRRREGT